MDDRVFPGTGIIGGAEAGIDDMKDYTTDSGETGLEGTVCSTRS